MKTLILNGSPRRNGDTAFLTERIRNRLVGEVMQLNCYYENISPCIDCRACRKNKGCSIHDGMQKVYDFAEDCDNVVIASPVYFSTLTGRLLDVAGRFQTYYSAEKFRGEKVFDKPKRGAIILTSGGSSSPSTALTTARCILRSLNVQKIYEPVISGKTDYVTARSDVDAMASADDLAEMLSSGSVD